MVSSPQPLQVDEVILNGVYDYYQRGRVSNILNLQPYEYASRIG